MVLRFCFCLRVRHSLAKSLGAKTRVTGIDFLSGLGLGHRGAFLFDCKSLIAWAKELCLAMARLLAEVGTVGGCYARCRK